MRGAFQTQKGLGKVSLFLQYLFLIRGVFRYGNQT